MQSKFPELTNGFSLTLRFNDMLQELIVSLHSVESAAQNGESPLFSEMLGEKRSVSIEYIIGGVPLWQLLVSTYLDFVADNNRRLLEVAADLVSGKSQP